MNELLSGRQLEAAKRSTGYGTFPVRCAAKSEMARCFFIQMFIDNDLEGRHG